MLPARFFSLSRPFLSLTIKRSIGLAKNDVVFTEINSCGIITLNRPKSLNALNLSMIRKIFPKMNQWQEDPKITHVVIEGEGDKSFCSGGDVLAVTSAATEGDSHATDFFYEEYKLNNLIGTYKKPFIALIDGITMGGGVGLSVHGPFRVSTDRTLFAMPETAIGLYPDVGGSYFLPRIPYPGLGMYLALTGIRLKGSEVFWAGIATHYTPSNKINDLKTSLTNTKIDSKPLDCIKDILDSYHSKDECIAPELANTLPLIDKYFGSSSALMASGPEVLVKELDVLAKSDLGSASIWAQKQLEMLRKSSPTSLKITVRQLTEGSKMSFTDVFRMEFRLSSRCARGHDFPEGVKALLKDKGRSPNWRPESLEAVTNSDIETYFAPLPTEQEWHP